MPLAHRSAIISLRMGRRGPGAGSHCLAHVSRSRSGLGRLAALLLLVSVGLALAPASALAHVNFGFVSQSNADSEPSQQEFSDMDAAGVGTYRTMFFWPFIEPSNGHWDWTSTDAEVANAAMEGVATMPFLLGSPSWLSGCSSYVEKCQDVPPTQTASQRAAWKQMLTELVQRYGPGGAFWAAHPELPQLPIHSAVPTRSAS